MEIYDLEPNAALVALFTVLFCFSNFRTQSKQSKIVLADLHKLRASFLCDSLCHFAMNMHIMDIENETKN